MAAAILRRKTGAAELQLDEDRKLNELPHYLKLFPCPSSMLKDLELGVLLGRNWQVRRVAYTTEVIAFARVNEDMLLDVIPLAEITTIESMHNTRLFDPSQKHLKNSYETAIDFTHAFQIRTQKDGQNAGRKYVLQASSDEEVLEIITDIRRLSELAAEKAMAKSYWGNLRRRVNSIYKSTVFQGISASLIVMNFSVSIYEAQVPVEWLLNVEGSATEIKHILDALNMTFTFLFTVELLVNRDLLSHKLREFVTNPWSVFDATVVLMSLIMLGPLNFPISMLRALRVVRLFGRLKSSKKILSALSVSLIPMCNAFFIMLVVAMMYSIMGVSIFREVAPACFGSFDRALSSMIRLTAGETWLEELVLLDTETGTLNYGTALFVFSYIVIVVWILLQVSVAVLLDNFVSHTMKADQQANLARIHEQKSKSDVVNPLEPLIVSLIKSYVDDSDLSSKLKMLYQVMDISGDGSLSCSEFCTSIKRLDNRIHMSESDFVDMTRNGELCNATGEIGSQEFESIMRGEIITYLQSRLTDFSDCRTQEDIELTHLGTLKTLLSEVLLMAREQRIARKELQIVLDRIRQSRIDEAVNPPEAVLGLGDTGGWKDTDVFLELEAMKSAVQTLTEGMERLLQYQPSDRLKSRGSSIFDDLNSKPPAPPLKLEIQDFAPVHQTNSTKLQRWRACLNSVSQKTNVLSDFTTIGEDLLTARIATGSAAGSNCEVAHSEATLQEQKQWTQNLASKVLVKRRGVRAETDETISFRQKQWPSFRKALGSRRKSLSAKPCLEQNGFIEADIAVAPTRLSGIQEQQSQTSWLKRPMDLYHCASRDRL